MDLLGNILKSDFLTSLQDLFKEGWRIDPETHKMTAIFGVEHDTPWIHIKQDPTRICKLYQSFFHKCGFIPTKCLSCWKVVVKPQTVAQLFFLYEVMKGMDRWSKCGIEPRPWTFGNYGGYFYTDSKEEGLERYMEVCGVLSEHDGLKDLVPRIILKRYCTEFEIKTGPSNLYKQPEGAAELEERILSCFDMGKKSIGQPDYLKDAIMRRWLEFAWDRGDPTAMSFNDGKPFYSPPVTYHQEAFNHA